MAVAARGGARPPVSTAARVAAAWASTQAPNSITSERLRLAGAAVGLLAGALGALVYLLHCPEFEAPFLAVWYVLGMSIPAAVGALAGPSVLRW